MTLFAGLALAVAPARAAETLPPQRVAPALLGGTPAARQDAPPAPTTAAAPPAAGDVSPPAPEPERTPPAMRQEVTDAPASMPVPAAPRPAGEGTVSLPAAQWPAGSRSSTTPFAMRDKESAPTVVTARRIDGVNDVEVVAEGDARLERAGDVLSGERIVYRQLDDEVEASGNVRLASPDTELRGPQLRLRLSESIGAFEAPNYEIRHRPPPVPEAALTLLGLPAVTEGGGVLATSGRMIEQPLVVGSGRATRLEFLGKDQYRLSQATYSTCAPGRRDWEIYVDELDLDYIGEQGHGRNAVVRFKDVPLLYLPWLDFSLNNQRKSGFLPPTIGSTSKSGLEIAAPWYWNIAPHLDATLTPRLMTRRGLQLNAELRYLIDTPTNRSQPGLPDKGQMRIEYLPGDNVTGRDRYGFALLHNQTLAPGLVGNLNLNGVSDDNYFSDLSTRVAQVSQGNLLRQGTLTYGGPWYTAMLNVQSFQTLQELVTPYRRLPQLTATAFRYDLPQGLAFNLKAEYVRFDHPNFLTGQRTTLYPQLSLPLAGAAFALTPKFGLHASWYALDRLDRPGQDNPTLARWSGVPASQSRAVPIFSVDGGFVMERSADWFGRAFVQTLEPRAFYVFIPRHDQSQIPVFDTGITGFDYAQMFSENRYAGGDRIGDANELTLAVTSRFLDPASGADLLRATLGTRYYFTDQYVTLPGETARSERAADLLAALAGQVLPHTYADIGWQYNPRDSRTEKLTFGGRYRPGAGRVVNASYRYARDLLGQIDVSAQWPLAGGWYGVGRYNYSTKEQRIIETIGGLEYDAGCWVGRFVVQRLATIADQPTTSLFIQLELNDFSRIGSNPMQLLRRSIPGYGVINQPTADPVFAEN